MDFAVKTHEYQKFWYTQWKIFVKDFGSKTEWSEKDINERTNKIAEILYKPLVSRTKSYDTEC